MSNIFPFEYKHLNSQFEFRAPIIGLGAQDKSSLALAKNKEVYLSRSSGNLTDACEFKGFEKKLKYFIRYATVRDFAFDLHPDYVSRQLIHGLSQINGKHSNLFGIQHHHAHIASCIFEHNIKGEVIGVAFDGTGFGLDGNLWGGDFFVGDLRDFKRVAHLDYTPLVGAEAAILEPNRIAASLLYLIYGKRFLGLKIGFVKKIDVKKWNFLKKMLENKINSPLSCSAGRLFDAVSALLGLVDERIAFEAEGPIKLEQLANRFTHRDLKNMYYNYKLNRQTGFYIVDSRKIIRQIVNDLSKKKDLEKIAFKFHNTLAGLIFELANIIRRTSGIKRIVLSGGVFTNKLLSSLARTKLKEKGFKVFEHKTIPPSDASICLGQILIANSKRNK
ncbi:MAG: hypothetical protein AB1629_03340 [Candidatus Omnitrophota bacterium]